MWAGKAGRGAAERTQPQDVCVEAHVHLEKVSFLVRTDLRCAPGPGASALQGLLELGGCSDAFSNLCSLLLLWPQPPASRLQLPPAPPAPQGTVHTVYLPLSVRTP